MSENEFESFEDIVDGEDDGIENDLDTCDQCGEEAWDGYICHSCGAKNI